jgi:hypothetical protein
VPRVLYATPRSVWSRGAGVGVSAPFSFACGPHSLFAFVRLRLCAVKPVCWSVSLLRMVCAVGDINHAMLCACSSFSPCRFGHFFATLGARFTKFRRPFQCSGASFVLVWIAQSDVSV